MGIKPSRSNKLMAEVMSRHLLKDCLEGIIKHLLVFLAPDIIFIGQLEKDIRCEEDQLVLNVRLAFSQSEFSILFKA